MLLINDRSLDLKALCPKSLNFLRGKKLLDNNNSPLDWENLPVEELQDVIKDLVEYEAHNVELCEKNYRRVMNRSIYGTLCLIITLSLFSVGLILLPTIVPIIAIPFLPIFLLCVAITAFARIFFKAHENYCDTEYQHAKKLLGDLKEIQADLLIVLADKRSKDELINENLCEQIQKISDNVEQVKKIVQQSMAAFMARKGMFKSLSNTEILADELLATHSAPLVDLTPSPSNA